VFVVAVQFPTPVLPTGHTEPTGHAKHELLFCAEYEPAEHNEQADCPPTAKKPGEQVQLLLPTLNVGFTGQAEQLELPVAAPGQVEHAVLPFVVLNKPAGQFVQTELPAAELNVPAGQIEHAVLPLVELK